MRLRTLRFSKCIRLDERLTPSRDSSRNVDWLSRRSVVSSVRAGFASAGDGAGEFVDANGRLRHRLQRTSREEDY
jgi:hypothetical protein